MAPRLLRAYPPTPDAQAPRPPRLRDWVVMAGVCAALGAFAAYFVRYSLGHGAVGERDAPPGPSAPLAAPFEESPPATPDPRDSPATEPTSSPLPPEQASLSPAPLPRAHKVTRKAAALAQQTTSGALAFVRPPDPVIPEVQEHVALSRDADAWPDLLRLLETQVCGEFQREPRRSRCVESLRAEVARNGLEALTTRCVRSGQAAPTLVRLNLDAPRPVNAVAINSSRASLLDRDIDAVLLCDPSLPENRAE